VKTWIVEFAVVSLVLIGVVAVTRSGPVEAVGTLAVLATFAHAQVAERMREKEALKAKPDVHCHRWSTRYFFAKELLWLSYFVAHRSWSALVGVGVFLAYPLWRKWWRARRPSAPKRVVFGHPSRVHINARAITLLPGSDIFLGTPGVPWSADLVLRLDREGCEHLAAASRARAEMGVVFDGLNRAGNALPLRLQFYDDPSQRDVRFARFSFVGVGELKELPRHV
jgi:hypothetical protein